MVLIMAALARTEIGEVVHKFDRRDPLDHLEAQLILASQTQRRAMQHADRRTVHLVGVGIAKFCTERLDRERFFEFVSIGRSFSIIERA
jgi:hypothetical protein